MQTNGAGHHFFDNKFHVKKIQSKMYVFRLWMFSFLHYVGGEEGPCKG